MDRTTTDPSLTSSQSQATATTVEPTQPSPAPAAPAQAITDPVPAPPSIEKPTNIHKNQTINQIQQPSDALKAGATQKPGKHINVKYVAVGAVALLLLLAVSTIWQQMAISQLKHEREVLGEQVRNVNPINAGGAGVTTDETLEIGQ